MNHNQRLFVGVVGEKRAGKDTFASFLRDTVLGPVETMMTSDVLFDTLELWGIRPSRHNLQQLPIAMDKTFGAGSLTRAVRLRMEQSVAGLVVLTGIRWITDYEMIRSFENNLLVYVTAEPEIRWERAKLEGGKPDEAKMSLEEFLEKELVSTEVNIPTIGKLADARIENNGTLAEFEAECEIVYREHILPRLN